jgi:hypothetical protein
MFAISNIVMMNISYNNSILKEFYNLENDKLYFLNTVKELNLLYGIINLILMCILYLISRKIDFKRFHKITIVILTLSIITLLFFKGVLITKTVIDLSLLSASLNFYYLNLIIIPLLIQKYKQITNFEELQKFNNQFFKKTKILNLNDISKLSIGRDYIIKE